MTTADLRFNELTAVAAGRWKTNAGPEWSNPGGGLWGGFALGLSVRVVEREPHAIGEALSLTATYAAALRAGPLDVRTRKLRQGGSIGIWQVEILPESSEDVAFHCVLTMAKRPKTTPFAFATMPTAPDPDTVPILEIPGQPLRYGAAAFERRAVEGYPPAAGDSSRSLAWVRSRYEPMDKALLAMVTDHSPPRAMYALGMGVWTTTMSLTAYLHATAEEIAALGNDFILVECEGRVGNAGASDERSSYWSRNGKLLATSEQLAWYR